MAYLCIVFEKIESRDQFKQSYSKRFINFEDTILYVTQATSECVFAGGKQVIWESIFFQILIIKRLLRSPLNELEGTKQNTCFSKLKFLFDRKNPYKKLIISNYFNISFFSH